MSLLARYPVKSAAPATSQPTISSESAIIKRIDAAAAHYAAVKLTGNQQIIAAAYAALTDAKNQLRAVSTH